jgi:DNA-binding transcriptional LysR family regulator
MNLDALKLYCDIVRLRSFSRGAKACQVTQSAASQAIQQLEEHLGLKLIDRSQRPFSVTPEGRKYYEGVRVLLAAYTKLEAEVKRSQAAVGGVVRIAAIYSIGLYDLSRYTQRFTALFPQAKVRLEYLRPNKVYDAVVNEEADIGILSFPKADRHVLMQPWRREEMVLVCPTGHPLAGKTVVTAAELEGERFVGFDPDLQIRKAIERALRQYHTHVNTVLEFDNIDSIKHAVETNGGISILPKPTVLGEAQRQRLAVVPLAMPELVRPVGLIFRRHQTLAPAVEKLIELFTQAERPVAAGQSAG